MLYVGEVDDLDGAEQKGVEDLRVKEAERLERKEEMENYLMKHVGEKVRRKKDDWRGSSESLYLP